MASKVRSTLARAAAQKLAVFALRPVPRVPRILVRIPCPIARRLCLVLTDLVVKTSTASPPVSCRQRP